MRNFKCTACGIRKLETNFTNLIVPVCKACKPPIKKKTKNTKED